MTAEITLDLVKRFPSNGPTDPIRYYRRPLTGWLFRERINLGLRMLGDLRFERALEVGYGSGAVQVALHAVAGEVHGLDLDADPTLATSVLDGFSLPSDLRQGSVYALPYPDAHFDLVVSFSTFEHLRDFEQALAEVRRVLRPGGRFLLGMPAVNKLMELSFLAIGFKGIDDHHVTTPQQVAARFHRHGFVVDDHARLMLPIPTVPGATVYYDWLLRRTP
jgi:SAM-dependent methyltransferase